MDEQRLESLQKAVETAPNDPQAQFDLGKLLFEAGRLEEAGPCFQRVLAIDSKHLDAYELLGKTQKQGGLNDLAVTTLTQGYRAAHRADDTARAGQMAALLKELGAEAPSMAETGSRSADGSFCCRRCGGSGPALEAPPMKGELGQTLVDTVCANCWREWIGRGTMVINELRLPMYEAQAQEVYHQQMKEFLLLN